MTRFNERAYLVFSGLIMVVGSLLSTNGGRAHPIISTKMGDFGTDTFFVHFAEMMTTTKHWESMHAQIMVAPALWALGGVAITVLIGAAGRVRWGVLGVTAMSMGAILWVVTYIFDGFVSNRIASLIVSGTGPKSAYIATFAAGQWASIRTSFVAWMLIVVGTTAFSLGLLSFRARATGLTRKLSTLLIWSGCALGTWSFVAAATGAFAPGPMVSVWYVPALIGTQWWYIFAGLLLIYLAVTQPPTAVAEPAERAEVTESAERAEPAKTGESAKPGEPAEQSAAPSPIP